MKKKKNNRGFTLVEMIVTVSILGVLSMVSLPILSNIQTSFSDYKCEMVIASFESAAKLYVDQYAEDLFGNQKSGCVDIDFDELVNKKMINLSEEEMKCIKDSSFVTITKINDTYTYEAVESGAKSCDGTVDETGPKIVLNPEKGGPTKKISVEVTLEDDYGYAANEKITYKWIDENDNVVKEGNYDFKNKYQETKDPVLKTTINSPTNLNGKYKLEIIPVSVADALGNYTTLSKKSKDYIFDNTPPTITTSTKVGVKDNLTFEITDNTELDSFIVTNSSTLPTTGWTNISGTNFKTTQTKQTSGDYYIHAKDKANNTATKKQKVVAMTPPTCSISLSGNKSGDWYTSNVTVKMTTSGTIQKYGLATSKNSTNSKTSVTHSSETSSVTYYGYVENEAGSSECSKTFKLDKGPSQPSINLNGYTSNTWTNKDVVISTSTSSYFNIDRWEYSHDNKSWSTNIQTWSASFGSGKKSMNSKINWDGQWNFYVRAVDVNGIASPSSSWFKIKRDTVPPVYTSVGGYSGNPWSTGDYQHYVKIYFRDDASGVATRYVEWWDVRYERNHLVNHSPYGNTNDTIVDTLASWGCYQGFIHKVWDQAGNYAQWIDYNVRYC